MRKALICIELGIKIEDYILSNKLAVRSDDFLESVILTSLTKLGYTINGADLHVSNFYPTNKVEERFLAEVKSYMDTITLSIPAGDIKLERAAKYTYILTIK